MELHYKLPEGAWLDVDRFDFLKYIADRVLRVDEVHQSKDNDSSYLWLIWLKNPDDSRSFMIGLQNNLNLIKMTNDQWTYEAYDFGHGFIMVHSWM